MKRSEMKLRAQTGRFGSAGGLGSTLFSVDENGSARDGLHDAVGRASAWSCAVRRSSACRSSADSSCWSTSRLRFCSLRPILRASTAQSKDRSPASMCPTLRRGLKSRQRVLGRSGTCKLISAEAIVRAGHTGAMTRAEAPAIERSGAYKRCLNCCYGRHWAAWRTDTLAKRLFQCGMAKAIERARTSRIVAEQAGFPEGAAFRWDEAFPSRSAAAE